MKFTQTLNITLIAIVATIIAAGCATNTNPGKEAAQDTAARIVAKPDKHLKQGMTAAELRSLLGAPQEVRALTSSEGKGETWVYVVRIPQGVNVVTGETVSKPYFDPFTNQMKEIQEPAYRKQEIVTLIERLSLLVYDGKLEKWVKTQDVEKKLQ